MNIERLFADFQLAEMEHNAQKTDVSLEKYETAKFAYERAVEKSKEPAPKSRLKSQLLPIPRQQLQRTVLPKLKHLW
jgi:hypothetical protein